MMKKYIISILGITLSLGAINAQYADITDINLSDANYLDELKMLLKKAVNQTETIDSVLEKLAQAVNSGSIKVSDKKNARKYISELRAFILELLENKHFELTEKNCATLLKTNKAIIDNLEKNTKSGFKNIIMFNTYNIITRLGEINSSRSLVKNLLLENNQNLDFVCKKFKYIGLSKVNILAKNVEEYIKSKKITKPVISATKRSLPYWGLAAYMLYINRTSSVKEVPVIGSFLSKVKKKIFGTAAIGRKYPEKTEKNKVGDKTSLPELKERYIYQKGFVSNTHKFFSSVADFKVEPIVTISVAATLGPIIKKDITDLARWTQKQISNTYTRLKGESVKDDSKVKKSKISFKDVIGFDSIKVQLNKLLDYFKNKDLYEITGLDISKSYLFTGPIEAGSNMAQALAGEITNIIKTKDKDSFCGVYEIHASDLVDNKVRIKGVVSAAQDSEPCIIVINELDWLYEHAAKRTSIWSNLSDAIRGIIRNKKKQVFIVATVQNANLLDNTTKALFQEAILFDELNLVERKAFFKKELEARCVELSNFDLEYIAEQTVDCSLTQLRSIINLAFTKAHLAQRSILQEDLEQSIDKVIYNIIIDKELSFAQKSLSAANISGKILAHKILNSNSKLVKATILPVLINNKAQHGAIIDSSIHDKSSLDIYDIETEVIIELTGLHAQKTLLLGKVLSEQALNAKKYAYEQAQKIVFEGIDKDILPNSVRTEKLETAWQLVEKWEDMAVKLVSEYKDKLEQIYKLLLEKLIISAQELDQI